MKLAGILLLAAITSCKTVAIKDDTCKRLTKNIEICQDDYYYGDKRVEFCRIIVEHPGYQTVTDKFRCEDIDKHGG